jgi:hypothetical protein
MKTARFLLACAVASVLAACGSDPITAPARPAAPLRDGAPINPSSGGQVSESGVCVKITVLNSDGTAVEVCVGDNNSQIGSGN